MLVHRKPNEDHIKSALNTIIDPASGMGLCDAQRIEGISIERGHVTITIAIKPQEAQIFEPLRQQAEQVLSQVKRVKKAQAILTAEKSDQASDQKYSDPNGANVGDSDANVVDDEAKSEAAATMAKLDSTAPTLKTPQAAITLQAHARDLNALPFVKHVIVVASGKGGVGKSTVAANLAAAMTRKKLRVGLLDADIYGPSAPRMLGLPNTKPDLDKDNQLVPHEIHGLKVMSIGFMIEEERPMIWRGPMVQTAIYQMLRDVAWGTMDNKLDVLIVDMPPGTGDAQLTLAQKVPLSGAVIVSTPQDIALLDARKGLKMFETVDVPVIGMIENMSTFVCPNCDHESHIFGHGGAEQEAKALGCDFLGSIPLELDIRIQSDEGTPALAQQDVMKNIAEKLQDYMRVKDE